MVTSLPRLLWLHRPNLYQSRPDLKGFWGPHQRSNKQGYLIRHTREPLPLATTTQTPGAFNTFRVRENNTTFLFSKLGHLTLKKIPKEEEMTYPFMFVSYSSEHKTGLVLCYLVTRL